MIAFTRYLPNHTRYEPGADEIIIAHPDGNIRVALTQVQGKRACIGVECDRNIPVWRGELFREINRENEDEHHEG